MMDFDNICRICLDANKATYDIFTNYYTKINTLYSEMLSNCTKIKPSLSDGLPRLICKDCCRQLKRTYSFNLQCEESENKLKTYLETKPGTELISLKQNDEIKQKLENEDNKESLLELLEENKDDIKLEPGYDENGWDADDNILLEDIKAEKSKSEAVENEEPPKRKRGRKKKDDNSVSDSKLPHQCDVCGKILSTRSNLKAHKICHTDQRPFKCTDCPAAFRGHSALFQHKKTHSGETPYHCEYCPKQFRRRTGFVNHIRMHTGEKKFTCDICFKAFVQSAQLSIHMKRHKGDKAYLCQDCGKGFPIKADLQVHQRIHSGEKPYPCRLCNKSFATAGNLSIHVRIHNKEIRYKCPECQRGFVTSSAFNVHLKRHKGQRDYQCECGKTFYTSSALKQHKVVHTGEKKYQCKICERKFSQTSHLTRHFKRDHMKPNAPIPHANQYKIVTSQDHDKVLFDGMAKNNVNSGVKCENS